MDSSVGSVLDPSRYPGEDTRPTSKKELLGWYSYGWASEVFVICGIGIIRHPRTSSLGLIDYRIIHAYNPGDVGSSKGGLTQ